MKKSQRGAGGIILRYLARTALWAVALAVLSMITPWTGVSAGAGAVSACALGALGIPGFALLLCVTAMF